MPPRTLIMEERGPICLPGPYERGRKRAILASQDPMKEEERRIMGYMPPYVPWWVSWGVYMPP